ncbi:asparagine synthase (glutamine-hydrolyzing) [Desulfotalea psychrophila]|uniref:asparagine synthase (glutamine-hydrolyzing) n=1 Tax=Desulfotalea psychrophila (strain LSv54 / DSM 12343) TaxID=177439 RepID=Q6ASA1_DESPS|nr:asparagine synthase (glutamine-hydrolyzing) [Desulfotalea psychrophila]CAG34762.1 probable asparagine synthetase (WbpS) [Desulfotalea psychrophila LSv54]
MCGLAGFFNYQFIADNTILHLQSMGKSISHRGPDASGTWYDADTGIGLVHTRLAIVDLSSAGHQPMHSQCDRYVIAFNGEIYNHLMLRQKLEQANQAPAWRGHSDTETLLACFVAWGIEQTLKVTVGMFALALWDKQEQNLTLARDRAGEKPLYWGWQGDTLLFGSELKALKAHPDFKAKVSRDALAVYMRHNYISAPQSIYEGIYKLLPGHYVTLNSVSNIDTATPKAYWTMNQAIESGIAQPFSGTDIEAVDLLEHRLSQSIGGQMLADVPLGAFLSGGVDSSVVVALMQKQAQQSVKTYAIGFDDPRYNEAQYAAAVARHLGTEHTELYVSAQDALELVPQLPSIYCEPFADSSQLPTFLVTKMARQHVTVALSGDGGDELFGGYTPYLFTPRYWNLLKCYPQPLRAALAASMSRLPLPDKFLKLAEVMGASNKESFYRSIMSHWGQPEDVVIGAKEPASVLNSSDLWPETDSFEHWMMAMEAQMYMPDDILVKVDRAAMANSLETRVPLLDHRVIELAWQLPLSMKIRDGKGKWVLREVLYRHVPRELIERPKKGFSIPLANWLRGPLRDWAEALLDEKRLRGEGYFYPAPIREAWQQHVQGKRDNASKLWSVLMFQAWLDEQDANSITL